LFQSINRGPPRLASELSGYWQVSDSSQHIDYIDVHAHVRELVTLLRQALTRTAKR
jgi:hypothetical protein